jgi:hypothetical protein
MTKKSFLERLDLEKNPLMKELKEIEGEVKLKDMLKGWGDLLIETWKKEGELGTQNILTDIKGNEVLPPEFLYYINHRGYDNEDCEVMYCESASNLIEEFIDWMLEDDSDKFGYDFWKSFVKRMLSSKIYKDVKKALGDTTEDEIPSEFTEEKFKQIIEWAKKLKHKVALVAAEH